MHEEVTLVWLTREALGGHLPALIELDAEVRAELGASYSSEMWGAQEFEIDLPGKWDLSVLAVDGGGAACAYLIASVKSDTTLYVHRFAVKAECRGRAVASRLVRMVAQAGAARSLDRMVLAAHRGNAAALGFYRSLGFKEAPATAVVNAAVNAAMDHRQLEVSLRTLAHA